jgi:transcriptional regulator with XRE-family HTH domain
MGLGMNGKQLAKLAGISAPYLTQLEKGLRAPSPELLSKLAGVLKTRPEFLTDENRVQHTRIVTHQSNRHGVLSSEVKETGVPFRNPQCENCVLLESKVSVLQDLLDRANATIDIFIKHEKEKAKK